MITTSGITAGTADIDGLESAIREMFQQNIEPPAEETTVAHNLTETEDSCWLHAALPGLVPGSIHLDVVGRTLTVRGIYHVAEVPGAIYLRRQLPHTDLLAVFSLSAEVDEVRAEAQYEQGILTVWLPRAQRDLHRSIKCRVIG